MVPRTEDPTDRPAQISNDLIIGASVYRNGGANSETHICDECLRVGVRAIKIAVSKVLGELDAEHDKDAEIARLTARLASLQHAHHNVCHDHNRMQDRLEHVLSRLDAHGVEDDEETGRARWEVRRGHIANEMLSGAVPRHLA